MYYVNSAPSPRRLFWGPRKTKTDFTTAARHAPPSQFVNDARTRSCGYSIPICCFVVCYELWRAFAYIGFNSRRDIGAYRTRAGGRAGSRAEFVESCGRLRRYKYGSVQYYTPVYKWKCSIHRERRKMSVEKPNCVAIRDKPWVCIIFRCSASNAYICIYRLWWELIVCIGAGDQLFALYFLLLLWRRCNAMLVRGSACLW